MADLSLYLLGPPRVKLDDDYIEVKPRKALALLIYLAVTAEPHSRDFLATLLWPFSDQCRARHALRNRLCELKQALGNDWIDAGREILGLRSGCWLDVAEFQQYLAQDVSDPQILSKATVIYRDNFLNGFTLPDCPQYDKWQYFQKEGLRQALASVLDRLVEILSDRGDYQTAVSHARRRLALDPLHEPACRQLMRLYALSGQHSAALRQYDLCRQNLAEELGVQPEKETTILYEQIRDGVVSEPKVTPHMPEFLADTEMVEPEVR
jgi:DNA-binding SARP family transcriptional activator